MADKEIPVKEMPLEERYERVRNFFEMDHAVSYVTHKECGTLDKWVNNTVDAYVKMIPKYFSPMIKAMSKLAPGVLMRQTFSNVLYADQMLHDPSEYEVSVLPDNAVFIRFKNCARYRRIKKIVKDIGLNIDPREICEVEKMHITHPNYPGRDSGITPVAVEWEETGCTWTFQKK